MKKTKAPSAKAKAKAPAKTESAGRRRPAVPVRKVKKAVTAKRAGARAAAATSAAARSSAPRPKRGVPAAKKSKPAKPERRASARPAAGVVAAPAAETSGEGCYVYCIIRSSTPLRFGGIGLGAQPSEVRTINYRDLAAVVSDTPLEVYDPTRENVLAHERVNDSVMREHTVLPMSFGTVFKTPQDIVELMRSAYEAFRDVLAKMEDKVEFGLKILWEPEAVIREIERRDENLRRVKEEISSQRGSTYFARMQYGRLVDSLLQERSAQLVSEIFETLRGVAIASRSNKPIGDKMILNAAFLVGRDREAEFDARVKEIGARHEHLNIRYTGPWPPYNFVNVRLKLERATED